MAGVRQTFDKDGIPHEKWRFWYRDSGGKRRWRTGTKSKSETLAIAHKIEDEHRHVRLGYKPKSASRDATLLYKDIKDEYIEWGSAQGGRGGGPWGVKHSASRKQHLHWWQAQLGLNHLNELKGILATVEKALRELLGSGRSPKTVAGYAESLAAFCDWCVKRDYLDHDPLKNLERMNTQPKTRRRAFRLEELQRLFSTSPFPRRILYAVACATGLRANELASLRVKHLDLKERGLRLEATWTKNRKESFQPVPSSLLKLLEEIATDKAPTDCLLSVPTHTARALDTDLDRAGIPKWTHEGKLDFHALRNTYATLVIESGANVKEAQTLMRHASPEMTMNIYARTRGERLGDIADKVGNVMSLDNLCAIDVQNAGGGEHRRNTKAYGHKELHRQDDFNGVQFESGRPDHLRILLGAIIEYTRRRRGAGVIQF